MGVFGSAWSLWKSGWVVVDGGWGWVGLRLGMGGREVVGDGVGGRWSWWGMKLVGDEVGGG